MLKTRLLFLLLLFPAFLFGQADNTIKLIKSEILNVDVAKGLSRVKKPEFLHQGAIMTCDSAHYWESRNYFEAFGNVKINQDTINISSDLLNYDGNTKEAHLIRNVRMSDPSSLLTTNIFYYNTQTRIGRYLTNGKIQNKEATVTSTRGYYFSSTNDAYFRENVIVNTNQVVVKSDTLRYNTKTNETYFYGPTDIIGKTDTLYTENGQYNTKTQKFFAGKNNLYTQDTKTLRGDSLYYDGIKGYGKAVKNIVFTDSRDQMELHGQLGEYFKETEKIRVQKQAYFALSTQDSITLNGKKIPDTLWLGASILEAEMVLQSKLKLIPKPVVLDDDEVGAEDTTPLKPLNDIKPLDPNKVLDSTKVLDSAKILKQGIKLTDSIAIDSIKLLKPILQTKPTELDSVKAIINTKNLDTTVKKIDSTKILILEGKRTDSLVSILTDSIPIDSVQLSKSKLQPKSLLQPKPNEPDTIKTRIIRAYQGVKIYKSNLQAKADSLFFAAADSTLRLFREPYVWSDSTQITGDTINVQIRSKKIDNAQIFQNAFISNQQADSTKFNQIKGKLVTTFFEEGEISDMYVDRNASAVVYDKTTDNQYNSNQTSSGRIRLKFEKKELAEIHTIKSIEGVFTPADANAKNIILEGFIWKPELRPKNKTEITGTAIPTKLPVKNQPAKVQTVKKQPAKAQATKQQTKPPAAKPVPSKKP